jgi:NADH-quinone oxidoreductase subunit L
LGGEITLVLLAIPSLVIGYLAIEPMLFGEFFKGVITVNADAHPAMQHLAHHYHEILHSPAGMALHGFMTWPFALALSGVVLSWYFYMKRPDIPAAIQTKFGFIHKILDNKYGFDAFNQRFFADGSRCIGLKLWQIGDVQLIDGAMVNGTANLMGRIATKVRKVQSGLIYHYAFAMIIGVFLLLTFFIKLH